MYLEVTYNAVKNKEVEKGKYVCKGEEEKYTCLSIYLIRFERTFFIFKIMQLIWKDVIRNFNCVLNHVI